MHAENVKEDKKMNRKKLIMILATITILTTIITPLFFVQNPVAASTYDADNMVVSGVLASDSYILYPYTKENLIFGFSKYGELINGEVKQGLEYDGMDVFANPNVLEKDWSQGWYIDIHYADLANNYKRAWAFALYSDISGSTGIGGDWKEGCTNGPLGTPYGGRKTNVWAITDDIEVLYDGPRRFVAVTNTTIYDNAAKTSDDALVSVTITFVFNKVKKYVILFKDIKRLDKGKFGRTFQVEFSNRGEWDIGTSAAPPSYAHFYDNLMTVYDGHYHEFYNATNDITGFDLVQMIDEDGSYVGFAAFWPQLFGKMVDGTTHITRDTILESLCTKEFNQTWLSLGSPADRNITLSNHGWPSADPYPRGLGAISDEPWVYKEGILLTAGGVDYTWNGTADEIVLNIEPADTDYITVVYKHEENADVDDLSAHVTEPDTPYVIGEWCFDLENKDHQRQFRAVTVYGLTDRHDADDDDADAETWQDVDDNVIDCEIQYYLDEIFNPFDLYSAVHKKTRRWVDFHTVTTAEVTAEMVVFNLTHTSVMKPTPWIEYCNSAEKVMWDGELRTPERASGIFGGFNYTLSVWPDGVGNITITGDNVPEAETEIKVLYTANMTKEKIDLITIEEGILSYQLSHWPVILNTDRFGPNGILVIDKSGEGPVIVTANYSITPENGTLTFDTATTGDEYNVIYEIWGGRYEWMVVGKDAATIDSIGAAYVTEAFDSIKNIDVQMTGMDINETAHGPYAPFVMAGATTGTKADYIDTLGRPHLRDDWCHTTPISSSNMIFEGGPVAQLGAEYFNEFTNAFFARTQYVTTDTGHANKILALSCWDKNTFGSGYAIISVYKDINGTIGFLIWGYDGQDTYYASQWFWDIPDGITAPDGTTVYSGIEYLQHENLGVTDIILEIDYPTDDPIHPTVSITERLGTISEKDQHDC